MIKTILLAGLLAGMAPAEILVQDRAPLKVIGSGAAMEVSPRQRSGFYTFIMSIGSKITLGTYTEMARYDSNNARIPLITIGPQVDYWPGGTVSMFIRPAKDLGDNFIPQKVSRFSLTAGVSVGEADMTKVIRRGFHKIFR